jgi:predicted Zn-dependent peptidase
VLVEILGGYFGSRLMKNIREEKGYTYGISSSLVSLTESGYLVIGTDVNVDNTQNTIDEVYKEIARLQTEPVSEDELNQVKNYLVGSFQSSLNSPFALCDKYKNIYFNTLQPDFYQQYIHTLLNTDSNSIQQLANQYFKLDSFTEIVAGVK